MRASLQTVETIYRSKVFRLCRETVILPNDLKASVDVIHHPGSSAVVPLLADDRVVMIRQYRPSLKGFLWEIPAGTRDPGEDFLQCAKRELMEEAGYKAKHFETLMEILPAPGYSDERIHVFLARDLERTPQHLDADEVLEVSSLPLDDALALIRDGRAQDAMTVIGLLVASERLRGGT